MLDEAGPNKAMSASEGKADIKKCFCACGLESVSPCPSQDALTF
jgi:hypothetical protein